MVPEGAVQAYKGRKKSNGPIQLDAHESQQPAMQNSSKAPVVALMSSKVTQPRGEHSALIF